MADRGEYREIPVVKAYFEDELDGAYDDDLKKVGAAAMEIAKRQKRLPKVLQEKNYSAEQIARVVDNSLSSAKVAYKVGKGELEPSNALDYHLAHDAAQMGNLVTKASGIVGEGVGALAGAYIGSIFGSMGMLTGALIEGIAGKVGGSHVAIP